MLFELPRVTWEAKEKSLSLYIFYHLTAGELMLLGEHNPEGKNICNVFAFQYCHQENIPEKFFTHKIVSCVVLK